MKIKQLIVGFAKNGEGWLKGCSSVTLIKGKKNILIDTGGKGFFYKLVEELKKEGLKPQDIEIVINTHMHPDHVWNNAFFDKAVFINSAGKMKDRVYWHKLPVKIEDNIELISTPGHSQDSCSVIVKDKKVYAITGDLFHSNKEKVPSYEKDKEKILEERKKILKIADFIIPGHGKLFSC